MTIYGDRFEKGGIFLRDLMLMEDGDLAKIGIDNVEHRKQILASAQNVAKMGWQPQSLPNLQTKETLK